ncbi:MAG: 16S rRNA (guanine(527)-N(7))-methyltransferase RsmG, partial [Fimbriimonadales bacterium]|nr:16S rRNA (guanine(527)-N(7))-methyltransferase RsmG [Fimbriimonadales bacterium]
WTLLEQVEAWGLHLAAAQRHTLEQYLQILYAANQRFNLTRVPSEQAVGRHLVDSLVLLGGDSPPEAARVLDIGTGAGLPGIPLKIARPDLRMTLLDSHGKTVAFLKEACEQLNLTEVQVVKARAEEWAHAPEAREQFDRAVARAVAQMPVLAELMLPYVRVGGVALALKSEAERAEIEQARPAVALLGGEMELIERTLTLESGTVARLIVRMEKRHPCDARYPRRWSQMRKRPLGGPV